MGFDRQRGLVVPRTGLQFKASTITNPSKYRWQRKKNTGRLAWRAEGDCQPNQSWLLSWAPSTTGALPPPKEAGFLHLTDPPGT